MENTSENVLDLVILANTHGVKMGKVLDSNSKYNTGLPQCPDGLCSNKEKVFHTSSVDEQESRKN